MAVTAIKGEKWIQDYKIGKLDEFRFKRKVHFRLERVFIV